MIIVNNKYLVAWLKCWGVSVKRVRAGGDGSEPDYSRIKTYYSVMAESGGEDVLGRVEGRRVLLVGAGNVGSHVALFLSRLPLEIVIVDDDVVGPENLGYQVFSKAYAGRGKAEGLASTLRDLGSWAKLTPLKLSVPAAEGVAAKTPGSLEALEALLGVIRESDLVVDALDDSRFRLTVWLASAMAGGKPVISAAYGLSMITVVGSPDSLKAGWWCYWKPEGGPLRASYAADPLGGGIVGSLAAIAALRLLLGSLRSPFRIRAAAASAIPARGERAPIVSLSEERLGTPPCGEAPRGAPSEAFARALGVLRGGAP
jgi:hypothetical protein